MVKEEAPTMHEQQTGRSLLSLLSRDWHGNIIIKIILSYGFLLGLKKLPIDKT